MMLMMMVVVMMVLQWWWWCQNPAWTWISLPCCCCCCSVAKSCPTPWPNGLQYPRLPCPPLSLPYMSYCGLSPPGYTEFPFFHSPASSYYIPIWPIYLFFGRWIANQAYTSCTSMGSNMVQEVSTKPRIVIFGFSSNVAFDHLCHLTSMSIFSFPG